MMIMQKEPTKEIFKDSSPFTNCISSINNNQIDNAEYKDVEKHLI